MNLLERKEIAPRVPRFSEVALTATFAQNRHLDSSVNQIALGSLAYEAQLLRNFTVNDPEKREAAKLIVITNNMQIPGRQNNVVIESKPRICDEFGGQLDNDILVVEDIRLRRRLLKKQRQDKFIVSSLHTHNVESPPSPCDLTNILLDDIEAPNAETCCFVADPNFNYLVFRSSKTPQLDISEFVKIRNVLNESWIEKEEGIKISNGLSEEKISELKAGLIQEFFNRMIREYKLIAFSGRADSGIVKKEFS